MISKNLILFVIGVIICGNAGAQVTIGSVKVPESYCILEVVSGNGNVGGIRVPQITNNAERTIIESKFSTNPEQAKGLIIYNLSSKNIEYWDGLQWISLKSTNINALNGLTYNGGNGTVELGGTLAHATSINTNNQTLALTGTTPNMFSVDNTTLSVDATKHRVGIGTSVPNATLEVNGNMRIVTTPQITTAYSTVVRNNSNGDIGVAPQLTVTSSTVAPGSTTSLDINGVFSTGTGFLSVNSPNNCGRNMNALFCVVVSSQDFPMTINYLNSMGRQIVGSATKISDYKYTLKFANVTACSGNGGATMFDFTIDTSTPGKVAITNNGDANRTYTIKISPM